MRGMSFIRNVLIAACAILMPGMAAPAWSDPAIPDFVGYAEDGFGDYQQCDSEHPKGPSHCGFSFKAEEGSSFLCHMISTLTSAYCVAIANPDAPESSAQDFSIHPTGAVVVSSTTIADPQTQLADAPVLPVHHKLVFNRSLGSSTAVADQVTCGAGLDGSVACKNAAGHGFVLSQDGSRTW